MRTFVVLCLCLILLPAIGTAASDGEKGVLMDDTPLFYLPDDIQSRWASMENSDALPGEAGKANFGRKGSAYRPLKAGESFVMAHGEGPGMVRRMWITLSDRDPEMLRGIILRMYWDGVEKPAVEVPVGDFFCMPLGRTFAFENAWFDSPEGRSFNVRIPMPFRKGFKITATNESPKDLSHFFYDVNYTLGDKHGKEVGYFHAHYRRENPTTLRRDFEILPKVEGKGRFLGCTLGCIADIGKYGKSWWGEGEVKVYLDGDKELPTLSGTGTEDYIATGWGQGQYAHLWHGCPLADHEDYWYGFYRLHGPDPVYFHKDVRVTIQQIGCYGKQEMIEVMQEKGLTELIAPGDGKTKWLLSEMEKGGPYSGFFERQDDWCAVAYFYLDKPTNDLPAIDPYPARVAGLKVE